jgi:exopolysaccharide biosynthesis polyprenyl glycosylphosphotransferase
MAASEPMVKPPEGDYPPRPISFTRARARGSISEATLTSATMMVTDMLAVLVALSLASAVRFYGAPAGWIPTFWRGVRTSLSPGYLVFFVGSLLIINRWYGVYGPRTKQKPWHEHRRTIQACLAAGLLLCGCMYVMHNTMISRGIVAYLIGFTTVLLCILRAVWRHVFYRRHESGLDTKNVLIVGANHLGNVIRKQIARQGHLGRSFKGFVRTADGVPHPEARNFLIGDLAQWSKIARKHFVDEIIIAEQCTTATITEVIETAHKLDVEVLAVLGYHDDLTPEAPIEYLANFPVVSLHRRNGKVLARLLKRVWDLGASAALLIIISPIMLMIALLIKLDSPGPVFYISQRIGKRGRSFSCFKFRTMGVDADKLKISLSAHNERSGPLFKMQNDPRVTRIGRYLRKFSLDELPQLVNVIRGDMSLVGPRPPIASEVEAYELEHLRRLEVLPGLTGLWQVGARQDPSFDRYVALDLTYVENWSLWLDLKILARTAQVVLRGTGS